MRQIGVKFIESETVEHRDEHGGKIDGSFKVKIPFLGSTKATAAVHDSQSNGSARKEYHVEYNLELAQDVSEILKANDFNKFIVLENFHYLSHEVQQTLAYVSGSV